jgi:hypothetical protein
MRREEYPTEQILVIKTTNPDHFLTETVRVPRPEIPPCCGFRPPYNQQPGPKLARPFPKRGYPKRTWAMCFGSVEDTNAAWAEYEGLSREAVGAQRLRIEKCKPKTKAAPASGVAEHVHTTTQHTRAIICGGCGGGTGAYGRRISSGSDDRRHDARYHRSHLQAHPQGQGPTPGVALAFGLHIA